MKLVKQKRGCFDGLCSFFKICRRKDYIIIQEENEKLIKEEKGYNTFAPQPVDSEDASEAKTCAQAVVGAIDILKKDLAEVVVLKENGDNYSAWQNRKFEKNTIILCFDCKPPIKDLEARPAIAVIDIKKEIVKVAIGGNSEESTLMGISAWEDSIKQACRKFVEQIKNDVTWKVSHGFPIGVKDLETVTNLLVEIAGEKEVLYTNPSQCSVEMSL